MVRPPGTDEPFNIVGITELAPDGELEERLYVVDLVEQRNVAAGGRAASQIPLVSAPACSQTSLGGLVLKRERPCPRPRPPGRRRFDLGVSRLLDDNGEEADAYCRDRELAQAQAQHHRPSAAPADPFAGFLRGGSEGPSSPQYAASAASSGSSAYNAQALQQAAAAALDVLNATSPSAFLSVGRGGGAWELPAEGLPPGPAAPVVVAPATTAGVGSVLSALLSGGGGSAARHA